MTAITHAFTNPYIVHVFFCAISARNLPTVAKNSDSMVEIFYRLKYKSVGTTFRCLLSALYAVRKKAACMRTYAHTMLMMKYDDEYTLLLTPPIIGHFTINEKVQF